MELKSTILQELASAFRTVHDDHNGAENYLYEVMTSNRVPMQLIMQCFHKCSKEEFLVKHSQDFTVTVSTPEECYDCAVESEKVLQEAWDTIAAYDAAFARQPHPYRVEALVGACKALSETEPGKAPMATINHAWHNMCRALGEMDAPL